jgi:hypothetical protein
MEDFFNLRPRTESNNLIICACVLSVIVNILQNIDLPLFSKQIGYKNISFPLIILYIISVSNAIVFMLCALFRRWKYNSSFFGSVKVQWKFFVIALFAAIGNLLLYCSSEYIKVPLNIQNILIHLFIPFTFVATNRIKNLALFRNQQIGVQLVVLGVLISTISAFINLKDLSTDETFMNDIWVSIFWIGIYIVSILLISSGNILQDKLYKHTSSVEIFQLLAWVSCYQVIILSLTYWVNFIPRFGSFTSMDEFREMYMTSLKNIFSLDFYNCLIYIIICIFAQVFSSTIFKYLTANLYTLLNTLVNPFVISLLIVYPSFKVDQSTDLLTIILTYTSLLFICPGIWYYTKKTPNEYSLDTELVTEILESYSRVNYNHMIDMQYDEFKETASQYEHTDNSL